MTALHDFLAAVDGFVARPADISSRVRLASARMKLVEAGIPEEANWTPLLRALVALAAAAHDARSIEERLDALAEIMALALANWRGALSDHAMKAPKAPPSKPFQYKDD